MNTLITKSMYKLNKGGLSGPPCLTPDVVVNISFASSYVRVVLLYSFSRIWKILGYSPLGNLNSMVSNNHFLGMWSNAALKYTNKRKRGCFFLLVICCTLLVVYIPSVAPMLVRNPF